MIRAVAILFCAAFSLAVSAAERPAKPNILLILADDLGWQDLKCYDIDQPSAFETPHIDRLAKEGVLFRQAYSPAPTCAPSRCGIMSGKLPARLNKTHVYGGEAPKPWTAKTFRMIDPFYSGRLGLDEVTIPEALKPYGYISGHSGKWHMAVSHNSFPQPQDQGFDWSRHEQGLSRKMDDRSTGFATAAAGDPCRLDENGFAHDQTTTDAIAFMAEAGDRPFFCYFATWFVHYPIQTRTRTLLEKYCAKMGIPMPQADAPMTKPGQNNPYYAAMVEEFDYMVHRVVSYLQQTDDPRWPGHKLIENTYVFLTSDNGGMERHGPEVITDNAPLDQGKQWAQEGGVRVPFIVLGPGIPKGKESNVVVNGLDLYPTFLALAGADVPEGVGLDGCNLKELLLKNPQDAALVVDRQGRPRDTMLWHFPHGQAMQSTLRKGDWKLIRNYDHVDNPGRNPYELYRLYVGNERGDIEEAKDLAGKYPERVMAMAKELEERLAAADARYPHYNPKFNGPLRNKGKVPAVLDTGHANGTAWVSFETAGKARVVRADLIYTLNGGVRNDEEWFSMPAKLDAAAGRAEAAIPAGTTHYLFNLIDENNFLVSSVDVGDKSSNRNAADSAKVPRYVPGR